MEQITHVQTNKPNHTNLSYPGKFHKTVILGGSAWVLFTESLEEMANGPNHNRWRHEHWGIRVYCRNTAAVTVVAATYAVVANAVVVDAAAARISMDTGFLRMLALILIQPILASTPFWLSAAFTFFNCRIFLYFIIIIIIDDGGGGTTLTLALTGEIFKIITSVIRLEVRVEVLNTRNVAPMEVAYHITKYIQAFIIQRCSNS